MQKEVFITTTAVYFPNSPIGNNQIFGLNFRFTLSC